MNSEQQAAYVLNRRPYQESSLIVDLFTLNYGKLSVVSKGALRTKSDKAALLQPFRPLVVSWLGNSSLKTLKSVEESGGEALLNGTALFCGYYINELVNKLLPSESPQMHVFGYYVQAINELINGVAQECVLRSFEFNLLSELGLLPDFSFDTNSDPVEPSLRAYSLLPQTGFQKIIDTQASGQMSIYGLTLNLISNNYSGVELSNAINNIKTSNDAPAANSTSFNGQSSELRDVVLKQAKSLMRWFVDEAFGGQKVQSRSLFHSVKF